MEKVFRVLCFCLRLAAEFGVSDGWCSTHFLVCPDTKLKLGLFWSFHCDFVCGSVHYPQVLELVFFDYHHHGQRGLTYLNVCNWGNLCLTIHAFAHSLALTTTCGTNSATLILTKASCVCCGSLDEYTTTIDGTYYPSYIHIYIYIISTYTYIYIYLFILI